MDRIALIRSLGFLCLMLTVILLAPLVLLAFWPEESHEAKAFLVPSALSLLLGGILISLSRGQHALVLRKHASSMILLVLWTVAVAICAIPFLMVGYSVPQAFFESMSGLTTTGLSVTDVEAVSHMVLLYRSLLHLIGGVGLVLVLTAILANHYGMQLFTAEGHTDRLSTSPFRSARTILSLYGGFILAGILLYIMFGMPLFDAVNYSISAVATGGFSIHADSIGHYQSVPIPRQDPGLFHPHRGPLCRRSSGHRGTRRSRPARRGPRVPFCPYGDRPVLLPDDLHPDDHGTHECR